MTEGADRLSKVKEALDEARLRRARGELSATEYRELLQDPDSRPKCTTAGGAWPHSDATPRPTRQRHHTNF